MEAVKQIVSSDNMKNLGYGALSAGFNMAAPVATVLAASTLTSSTSILAATTMTSIVAAMGATLTHALIDSDKRTDKMLAEGKRENYDPGMAKIIGTFSGVAGLAGLALVSTPLTNQAPDAPPTHTPPAATQTIETAAAGRDISHVAVKTDATGKAISASIVMTPSM